MLLLPFGHVSVISPYHPWPHQDELEYLDGDNFEDMMKQMNRRNSPWRDFGRWARELSKKAQRLKRSSFVPEHITHEVFLKYYDNIS